MESPAPGLFRSLWKLAYEPENDFQKKLAKSHYGKSAQKNYKTKIFKTIFSGV